MPTPESYVKPTHRSGQGSSLGPSKLAPAPHVRARASYTEAMDRQHKKNRARNKPGTRIRHGGSQPGLDQADEKSLKAGKKLGNEALQEHISGASAKRDQLLQFIIERLQVQQQVQGKESDALRNQNEWYRAVFLGKPGFHVPDPGRWAEAAGGMKKAGEALCRGDLGRATQILERALESESAAFEALPEQVLNRLNSGQAAAHEGPAAGDGVSEEVKCPTRTPPPELRIADRIMAVQPMQQRVAMKGKRPHDWWTGEDEEEEKPDDSA